MMDSLQTEPFALPATTQPGGVPGVDRAPFEAFLIHEGRLLDERRFRDWMALFDEDGFYWVPARADQNDPYSSASLFFDDRDLMTTRIDRLEHPEIHVQTPPSRTNHLIGNIVIEEADEAGGLYLVSSSVWMAEYRLDVQRIFSGRQFHRLRKNGTTFAILLKRVHLINCDAAFEAMAVPI